MNSSSITGAASPLTLQFEATRPADEPSVPEIDPAEELETAASNDQGETEAGLIRLTEFLKRRKLNKNHKNHRAIQAYEHIKHFEDHQQRGSFLNKQQ